MSRKGFPHLQTADFWVVLEKIATVNNEVINLLDELKQSSISKAKVMKRVHNCPVCHHIPKDNIL